MNTSACNDQFESGKCRLESNEAQVRERKEVKRSWKEGPWCRIEGGSAPRRKNLAVVSRRGYYACLNVPRIRVRLPTQGDRPFNIAGIRLIYECPGYI